MQVMSLEGGMKGWVNAGTEYTQLMDGYQPQYWGIKTAEPSNTVAAPVADARIAEADAIAAEAGPA